MQRRKRETERHRGRYRGKQERETGKKIHEEALGEMQRRGERYGN